MILSEFKDFPRVGRILGIDWGARRIGVAVTDEGQEFFFTRPQIVLGRSDDGLDAVAQTVVVERVAAVVVGLPLRTDGTLSDTTRRVYDWAEKLAAQMSVPIFMIDETLSSASAQESFAKCRRRDIKEKLDSAAARVILENAIAMARRVL